ncbi:MAG: acetate/propionate family kinase [Oscillospiraceae bacterium]|nr:acetate/propionate family kinase [Oscillospiraceae bacterium]
MKVLVCNVGSTSLKFKLYDMPDARVLAQCGVERVGSDYDAIFRYENCLTGQKNAFDKADIPNYESGIRLFLDYLTGADMGVISAVTEIERVGYKATLSKGHFGIHELDEEVLQGMEDWLSLAPLHNRAYLDAIAVMRGFLPEARFIGCFETAFHRDIPLERKIYGVPYEWYERYGVQRLGYHGASHGYIADVLNEQGRDYKAISCHLGGSCSVCAIENGRSVDTSFGMSLESGLIHANRVGDMDTSMSYFLRSEGMSDEEILQGLQKKGGLLGISGVSNDLRYVIEAAQNGNERAKLALDVFVTGIVHYIGAFAMDLGRLDYLVFTAGIGEHSALLRERVCEKLGLLGVKLDEEKNAQNEKVISAADSAVRVLVIPTNEELGIARRTYEYQ